MLWAMVGQSLDPDQSCNNALARIQAHRARLGLSALSDDTGGYCRARQRLPEGFLSRLFRHIGAALTAKGQAEDLWYGRVVKVVDGSASSMPDTPKNQAEYPQPASQKPGCGFPILAYVGVFCLATGAALDLALGKWFLHDLTLFYFVREIFQYGDIMLADRGFCSYAEIALMQQRGVDTVMRLHHRRLTDFRRGKVIGVLDHLVTWPKPAQCPRGLRMEDYLRLPETLALREIRYPVAFKGFRTVSVTLVTTLLDPKAYSIAALAELYFRRWQVELDFRHLKITMQMDVLRGKSPDVVRKEIWTHLLAYNLIHSLLWEAARKHGVLPGRLSVKGTMQQVDAHEDLLASATAPEKERLITALTRRVAGQIVPLRPNRVEPRVRKRRPKNYRLMMQPRAQLKARLCG